MLLSTDNVKELQTHFDRYEDNSVSLVEFVSAMRWLLRSRIIDEVEFTIRCIDLFETIDINGDGSVAWSEFSKYMVEAGEARLASTHEHEMRVKKYQRVPWFNEKPILMSNNCISSVVFSQSLDAIIMLEDLSDEVSVYSFRHERDDPPRLMSTIKHHTSYEPHEIDCIHYVDPRELLVTSSKLKGINGAAFLSFWNLKRLTTPVLLDRLDCEAVQTSIRWISYSQQLVTAASISKQGLCFWDLSKFAIVKTINKMGKVNVLLEASKGCVVSGSTDGTITIYDPDAEQVILQIEAHEFGVQGLTYSSKHNYFASFGFLPPSQAYKIKISIWNKDDGKLKTYLSGHSALLIDIETVDQENQLITADESGIFRVWSSDSFDCLEEFQTKQLLRSFLVLPPLFQHDTMLLGAGESVEIYRYFNAPKTETIVFVAFNAIFSLFLIITSERIIHYDAETGQEAAAFLVESLDLITAACMDERGRKLILGDHSGRIGVINIKNGVLMKYLDPHASEITSLAYVHRSKCVISTSTDATVRIYDENDETGFYKPVVGHSKSVILRTIRIESSDETSCDITQGIVTFPQQLFATLAFLGTTHCHLNVWDYETTLLDGVCQVPPSIATGDFTFTSIAFLEPYRGIVAGRPNGTLLIYGLRGSGNQYRCVMELSSSGNESSIVAVQVVLQDNFNLDIVAADDTGWIYLWKLEKEQLERYFGRAVDSTKRLQRETRVTHTTWSWKDHEKLIDVDILSIKYSNSWKAFNSRVAALNLMMDPKALVACCSAGRLRIWDLQGKMLGQVTPHGDQKKKWNIQINNTTQLQHKLQQAKDILVELRLKPMDEFSVPLLRMRGALRRNLSQETAKRISPRSLRRSSSLCQIYTKSDHYGLLRAPLPEKYSSQEFDASVIAMLADDAGQLAPITKVIASKALASKRQPSSYTDRHPSFVLQLPERRRIKSKKKLIMPHKVKRYGRLDSAPKLTQKVKLPQLHTRKNNVVSQHIRMAHIWQHYK